MLSRNKIKGHVLIKNKRSEISIFLNARRFRGLLNEAGGAVPLTLV